MTISNTKTLAEIITDPRSRLGRLINRAQQLVQITHLFRTAAGSELAQHCSVGYFDGTTLSLVADSAAWATQLRFAIPDLIKTLKVQPEFKSLEKIRYSLRKTQL